jgi:hypothetical protein
MNNETGIVQFLKKEQDRLTKELRGIGAALAAFGKAYGTATGTRKVSALARVRMAAAQKAGGQKLGEQPQKEDRAAAQRARWAKVKAGKKTA